MPLHGSSMPFNGHSLRPHCFHYFQLLIIAVPLPSFGFLCFSIVTSACPWCSLLFKWFHCFSLPFMDSHCFLIDLIGFAFVFIHVELVAIGCSLDCIEFTGYMLCIGFLWFFCCLWFVIGFHWCTLVAIDLVVLVCIGCIWFSLTFHRLPLIAIGFL